MEGLTVGRIVHYVLDSGRSKGDHRPAIIVRDWSNAAFPGSEGMVQLQVFTDGSNDGGLINIQAETMTPANVVWRTSVHYSETKEPGTWHWPERA